jgi:heat-inducible transcriptional repressor
MADLTPRQLKILKTIIEENIHTGEPVGSEMLDKKYNLGVSPATIRNEMAFLEKEGYLKKPHTSAGRLPTNRALKIYIKQLMEEKQLSVTDEVAVKEKIWGSRHELNKLLTQATKALASKTASLAITTTDKGDIYHAGYSNVLDLPEFFDIDVTKTVLSMIEDFEAIDRIFSRAVDEEPIHILLGEELGSDFLSPCGLIFTDFNSSDIKGRIGVLGPSRFDYPYVIPTVRYFGKLINDILKKWE